MVDTFMQNPIFTVSSMVKNGFDEKQPIIIR